MGDKKKPRLDRNILEITGIQTEFKATKIYISILRKNIDKEQRAQNQNPGNSNIERRRKTLQRGREKTKLCLLRPLLSDMPGESGSRGRQSAPSTHSKCVVRHKCKTITKHSNQLVWVITIHLYS